MIQLLERLEQSLNDREPATKKKKISFLVVTTLGSQCYTLNKFDNKSVVLLLKGISILKVSGSNNSTSVLTTSTRTMREDKTQQGSSIFVILETRLELKPTGLTVCPDRFQSPPFILGADQLVFRAKTRNDR